MTDDEIKGSAAAVRMMVEAARLLNGPDYFDRLAMKAAPDDRRNYQADPYLHMRVDAPAKAH